MDLSSQSKPIHIRKRFGSSRIKPAFSPEFRYRMPIHICAWLDCLARVESQTKKYHSKPGLVQVHPLQTLRRLCSRNLLALELIHKIGFSFRGFSSCRPNSLLLWVFCDVLVG